MKKTRIELLETRRQKIESIKFELSNRSIDITNVKNIESIEAFSRMVDFFQKNSSSLFSIGHLIGNEFITELKKLNKRIDENIVKAKQNVKIDSSEIQKTYNRMVELGNKMQDELDICLLNIENEIQNLLK